MRLERPFRAEWRYNVQCGLLNARCECKHVIEMKDDNGSSGELKSADGGWGIICNLDAFTSLGCLDTRG